MTRQNDMNRTLVGFFMAEGQERRCKRQPYFRVLIKPVSCLFQLNKVLLKISEPIDLNKFSLVYLLKSQIVFMLIQQLLVEKNNPCMQVCCSMGICTMLHMYAFTQHQGKIGWQSINCVEFLYFFNPLSIFNHFTMNTIFDNYLKGNKTESM